MATAAAAGATTLIAQYFSDGFYPSGKRTVNLSNRSNYDKIIVKRTDYIEPSMTLLKAILTNRAGTISSSSKIPDCTKRFGLLHVSEALLFDNETEKMKRFGLRISGQFYVTGEEREDFVSEINLLNENQELERKSLIVTLAWLDPPISEISSLYPIYADLDLFIEFPDGKVVYGNQIAEDNEEMYSTTERVTIENPIGGKYKLHVTCPKLLTKVKILPSVVVTSTLARIRNCSSSQK